MNVPPPSSDAPLARPTRYTCSNATRWLPHALAAAILAAGLALVADAPQGSLRRPAGWVGGAIVAWWVLRSGRVLRRHVRVDRDGLVVGDGASERTLELRDLATVRFEFPFEAGRQWVPLLAVVDRFERRWAIPAALVDGERFLAELVEACDREDLRTWTAARAIGPAMATAKRWTARVGYAVAVGAVGIAAYQAVAGALAR